MIGYQCIFRVVATVRRRSVFDKGPQKETLRDDMTEGSLERMFNACSEEFFIHLEAELGSFSSYGLFARSLSESHIGSYPVSGFWSNSDESLIDDFGF